MADAAAALPIVALIMLLDAALFAPLGIMPPIGSAFDMSDVASSSAFDRGLLIALLKLKRVLSFSVLLLLLLLPTSPAIDCAPELVSAYRRVVKATVSKILLLYFPLRRQCPNDDDDDIDIANSTAHTSKDDKRCCIAMSIQRRVSLHFFCASDC